MTFLQPLGLLGLLAIPLLIIIYIIKNKYMEQTVASTYLWTLSRQFMKRKRRITKLAGLVSLVLQILAVALISVTLAHPVITLPGEAKEYCFVLDGSGSMQMEEGGITRFEKGKAEIASLIDGSTDGSTYTLILSDATSRVVFEHLTDRDTAKKLLEETVSSHTSPDMAVAMSLAQPYFDKNASCLTYLITDTAYTSYTNVEPILIGTPKVNAGIVEVSSSQNQDGLAVVTAELLALGGDTSVTLDLYMSGIDTPVQTKTASLTNGAPLLLSFDPMVDENRIYTAKIREEDALSLDNTYIAYTPETTNAYPVLLVSNQPFFWEGIFAAYGGADVTVVSTKDYNSTIVGYGLYVFDNCAPATLPKDGAVWLINPSVAPDNSNFSVKGEVVLERGGQAELTKDTSSLAKKLTANMTGENLFIKEYNKCGFYGDFLSLLHYQSNPLIVSGTNGFGNRQVVFTFDIHNSNLPITVDFIALVGNLLSYSFPPVLEDVIFQTGEEVTVNLLPGCESVSITAPSGKVTYLTVGSATREFMLQEVGDHTVTLNLSGVPREYRLFSQLTQEEWNPAPTGETVGLSGTYVDGGIDGIYDNLTILLICLMVVFLADWGIYCYEKYQLR